jgi:hypothetical protein
MNNGETRDAGLAIAPPLLPDHPPMFRHLDPAAALAFRTPLQEHPPAADTKATATLTALGIMFPLLAKFEGGCRTSWHGTTPWPSRRSPS